MSDECYWAGRLAQYGHTGWSDAAVYAYDQHLRVAALATLLEDLPGLDAATALDFGCGVGDFCALLATRCRRVVGHDLSRAVLARAAQEHSAPQIRYEPDLDVALAPPLAPYGLVLSVTVLQHVVDDAALASLLRRLAAALQHGGHFIVLESFATTGAPASSYLKRRSLAAFTMACADAGLVLSMRRGFYHPSASPTSSFTAYNRRPDVRVLARLEHWRVPGARRALQGLARRAAAQDREFMDHSASPTQWLMFERSAS